MSVYPEAFPRNDLKPGPWTVENSHAAMVDFKHKHFRAPLHDGMLCECGHDHAEGLRVHEYAHVAFTPANYTSRTKRNKLSQDLVDAVEDCRVSRRLEVEAKETLPPVICPEAVRRAMLYQMRMRDFPGLMITMAASHSSEPMRVQVSEFVRELFSMSLADFKLTIGDIPGLDDKGFELLKSQMYDSLAHAKAQLNYLGARHDPFAHTIEVAKRLRNLSVSIDEAVADAVATGKDAFKNKPESTKIGDLKGMVKVPGTGDVFKVPGMQWCKMKIETAPLTRPAKVEPTRKWTTRDEGVIPQAIHRWCVDGRIFKQPVHRGEGYTVLIDCSGSMSWNVHDLEELLARAPATTVALYSSDGDRNGTLRIVAQKGKRAEGHWVRPPAGGGNGVDGPALRWLGQQKGRHIWVCDGHVTGIHDQYTKELSEDAKNLVVKHDVMRICDGRNLVDIITGKIPFKPTPRDKATASFG